MWHWSPQFRFHRFESISIAIWAAAKRGQNRALWLWSRFRNPFVFYMKKLQVDSLSLKKKQRLIRFDSIKSDKRSHDKHIFFRRRDLFVMSQLISTEQQMNEWNWPKCSLLLPSPFLCVLGGPNIVLFGVAGYCFSSIHASNGSFITKIHVSNEKNSEIIMRQFVISFVFRERKKLSSSDLVRSICMSMWLCVALFIYFSKSTHLSRCGWEKAKSALRATTTCAAFCLWKKNFTQNIYFWRYSPQVKNGTNTDSHKHTMAKQSNESKSDRSKTERERTKPGG